jgi:CRP/FNR family transcriptional regulator, anaerobic regulatory protein
MKCDETDLRKPPKVANPGSGRSAQAVMRLRCQQCAVRIGSLCGALPNEVLQELSRVALRRRVRAGQLVSGGHQRAKVFAVIVSGVVKIVNAKPDGRQQIVGLQFPSDFVGAQSIGKAELSTEAATDLDLCWFSGPDFTALLRDNTVIQQALLARVVGDLDAAREWMFVLGRKSAQERVASLLLMVARRSAEAGLTGKLTMPLSRTEMADYLCLRLETVSRQIAQLQSRSIIATEGRRLFTVLDMEALVHASECSPE